MEEQESGGTRSTQSAVMDDFLCVFSVPQIPKKVMHCWSDCVSTTTCSPRCSTTSEKPIVPRSDNYNSLEMVRPSAHSSACPHPTGDLLGQLNAFWSAEPRRVGLGLQKQLR